MVAKRCFQNVIGIRTILDFPGRGAFSLLAQDSPIAAQNSLSWFFPAGNLDGDSVPHSHGTHKILDFGYLAPHECVRSRTPTAYRELLCNYKVQEDYAMARPKKDESLHRGKRVYIRFTELEYELVARYAKDAGYPIGTFVRKQALREKLEVNAHAAIVTRDEYYQAQKAIRNVTPIQYKVGDEFALKGKICCGNCNRQLRHERQYGEMVFYCGYKRSAGKFSKCYGGYYREYSVNAKVARAIKTVFYALDVVNQGMQEKQSITVRCMDIEDLEKQAEAIRVEQIKLYESYADGVLLRDAYIEKKKALSEKLAALQDSIRIEKEEQECADELDEEIRALTKQASEKTYIGGLTKECVDAFVSMVYLYDDQTMKIEFNCEDVIRRALEKYGA